MAEDRPGQAGVDPQIPDPAQPAESVGEYLAKQRKLRGISLDELCERTKIPRRNLERLESGAFDAHRDGFARGFVRTVALDLGLDADEAVMRLVGEPSPDDFSTGSMALGWLLRGVAVAGLALAVFFGWRLWLWAGEPSAEVASEVEAVTYRRDVVRSLADDAPPPAPLSSAPPDATPPAAKSDAPAAEAD